MVLYSQVDSGNTSPSSRASLYSRLDQLDAESSDADLLSPDSALYSRVSDLDSTSPASGETASSRSSYTYPTSNNNSSSSNNTYQTARNVLQTTRDEVEEDVHGLDNNYSDEYYNNRNNRSYRNHTVDDTDDFGGTLTFTNRSRSGSLNREDNDLNNDLEDDTLTHKRWSCLDDNDTTDIPIVYSRRNDEEDEELENRKKEEEEQEEEYIPVYTPERLKELTGEDNFTFSGGSRRRRRRRNRGYTSDNTEYVGPRDRFM